MCFFLLLLLCLLAAGSAFYSGGFSSAYSSPWTQNESSCSSLMGGRSLNLSSYDYILNIVYQDGADWPKELSNCTPQTELINFFPQQLMNHHLPILIAVYYIVLSTHSQSINMVHEGATINLANNGQIADGFVQTHNELDCGMPQLYILSDTTHQNYTIVTSSVLIESISSPWDQLIYSLSCSGSDCEVTINSNCESLGHVISWVQLSTSIGRVQYLVNCNPGQFYKPFEMGLFLLIMLSTAILTLSAKYSRAWSYGGYGYQITKKNVLFFNLFLLLFIIIAYLSPQLTSILAKIVGSLIGASGVAICLSQTIWLCNIRNLLLTVYKKIRILDIICWFVGILFIPLYWLLNGQWFVNDIMAVCSIVAFMKLLKIRSLSIAVYLLLSLLMLQSIVGLFVHYVLNISYNNYIINMFQNPILLVLPSITREIYRSCAWLPITAVLFPGLVISYLRRFDHSRSTHVYFVIGLVSFYIGSVIWMFVDMETIHSLPFAIISQPITFIIVAVHGIRRNEFKILWTGNFYDEELNQSSVIIHDSKLDSQITAPTAYAQLANSLRADRMSDSSDNYHVIQ